LLRVVAVFDAGHQHEGREVTGKMQVDRVKASDFVRVLRAQMLRENLKHLRLRIDDIVLRGAIRVIEQRLDELTDNELGYLLRGHR
jgi:hypothetical protein